MYSVKNTNNKNFRINNRIEYFVISNNYSSAIFSVFIGLKLVNIFYNTRCLINFRDLFRHADRCARCRSDICQLLRLLPARRARHLLRVPDREHVLVHVRAPGPHQGCLRTAMRRTAGSSPAGGRRSAGACLQRLSSR